MQSKNQEFLLPSLIMLKRFYPIRALLPAVGADPCVCLWFLRCMDMQVVLYSSGRHGGLPLRLGAALFFRFSSIAEKELSICGLQPVLPTDYTDFHRLHYTFLHEIMIIMIISDKELSIYRAFTRACARTKMLFLLQLLPYCKSHWHTACYSMAAI